MINIYEDVLPHWWYVVMQCDLLCHDPLDIESSGQRHTAGHDLLPPLHLVPCFLVEGGGAEIRRSSIFPPAVSTHHLWSAFKLALIWRLRHCRRPWLRAGSMETLVSKILHVSAKIHMFLLASCALILDIV